MTVRVRPGTLIKLLLVNDLREFLFYAGIGAFALILVENRWKNVENSSNSRKYFRAICKDL